MLNFFWRLLAELLACSAIATRIIERAQRPRYARKPISLAHLFASTAKIGQKQSLRMFR